MTTETITSGVESDDIAALLEFTDDEFADLVDEAVTTKTGPVEEEPDWQCLMHPQVVARTRTALFHARDEQAAGDG